MHFLHSVSLTAYVHHSGWSMHIFLLYPETGHIRENYKNPALCLSKISDEFHISESYFSHMFKENMNVNFSVYLEDLRLTEAAHLIEKGESGINEIALEVGYNNQTSFRRAFKKKYGMTPLTFINKLKNTVR